MKCIQCNNQIDEKKEYCFIGYWNSYEAQSGMIHFHVACFQEVAGKKYLNVIRSADKHENINFIETATGTGLDLLGETLRIKRYSKETDGSYRQRLTNHALNNV